MTATNVVQIEMKHVSADYIIITAELLLASSILPATAHMWFENKVCNANTNEDIYQPEKTRRVSKLIDRSVAICSYMYENSA